MSGSSGGGERVSGGEWWWWAVNVAAVVGNTRRTVTAGHAESTAGWRLLPCRDPSSSHGIGVKKPRCLCQPAL
jgi:hypothetical protein